MNQHTAFAGDRIVSRCRLTGALISVTDGKAAQLDTSAGRWQTICHTHGSICSHRTFSLAVAHASMPEWCEDCQAIMRGENPRVTLAGLLTQ